MACLTCPVASFGSLELSWDWNDPRVRDYPRLRLKLVLGYVLGVIAVGTAIFLTHDATESDESALFVVSAVVAGYTVPYPLVVGIVIGNIKRLVPLPDPAPDDR